MSPLRDSSYYGGQLIMLSRYRLSLLEYERVSQTFTREGLEDSQKGIELNVPGNVHDEVIGHSPGKVIVHFSQKSPIFCE